MAFRHKYTWMRLAGHASEADLEHLLDTGNVVCRQTCAWYPPVDIYEDDDSLVVQVEVAGMASDDFSISLSGQKLVIAGVRKDSRPKRMYHQMEIRFGEFRVEIYLPWSVESEAVLADYEAGFLSVRLPRKVPQS